MLRQTFTSVIYPYRTPAEWAGVPDGIGLGALYNAYLITPPRIYAEELAANGPKALFVRRTELADAHATVDLIAYTNRIYWPGWGIELLRFNAATGAFIGRADVNLGAVAIAWTNSITAGYGGTLWWAIIAGAGGNLYQVNPDTFATLQTIAPATFGLSEFQHPVVDQANDRLTDAAASGNSIKVYELSTGSLLHTINVSGDPMQLCPEDSGRVYVLNDNYIINVVDIVNARIIGTLKCPVEPGATNVAIAWDNILRRLFVISQTPNNSDGSATTKIRGYYPATLPAVITTPIPLQPPRAQRTVPVAARLIDDLGQPINGALIQAQITSSTPPSGATITAPTGISNGDGYGRIQMAGLLESAIDIQLSANT